MLRSRPHQDASGAVSDSAAVGAAGQHLHNQGSNLLVCANAAEDHLMLPLQSAAALPAAVAAAAVVVLPPLPVVREKQSQVLQMAAGH